MLNRGSGERIARALSGSAEEIVAGGTHPLGHPENALVAIDSLETNVLDYPRGKFVRPAFLDHS